MMRRMRNQRSYTVDPADFDLEPESSNYYPITTGIEKGKTQSGKEIYVFSLHFFFGQPCTSGTLPMTPTFLC